MVDALTVAAVEVAVDPGEPDCSAEERNGGELFEDLHPCAGTWEDAGPGGLEAEQQIGSG